MNIKAFFLAGLFNHYTCLPLRLFNFKSKFLPGFKGFYYQKAVSPLLFSVLRKQSPLKNPVYFLILPIQLK